MAIVHLCDGCGKPAESVALVGVVVKREYCETCAVIAQEFLVAEDALRVDLVEQFATARKTMIDAASQGGFKLPDVL